MRIIVDAMGGDNAPAAIVKGALLAGRELSIDITFVGREEEIRKILAESDSEDVSGTVIVNAAETVEMTDNPAKVIMEKKDSSLVVALRLLGQDQGDAMVSAGNTGALLVGGTTYVKRIRGIRRAALAPVLPTAEGGAVLIDSGANVECTPEYLLQFAYMGSYYAKTQLGKASPRVALINNGTEAGKGNALTKEAYKLLCRANDEGALNFIGNIEGRDIALGRADVIVCDGFTGNIILKTIEGIGLFFLGEMKAVFKASVTSKIAALALKKGLYAFKRKIDYKEVGGAPLLGLSKPVIKAHGSSDESAMRSAVRQAVLYRDSGIIESISENISFMTAGPTEVSE